MKINSPSTVSSSHPDVTYDYVVDWALKTQMPIPIHHMAHWIMYTFIKPTHSIKSAYVDH